MLILIEKDGATRIPKDVKDATEAEGYAADFPVFVVNDDGSSTPFADWKAVQANAGVETKKDETVVVLEPGASPTLEVETQAYNDGIDVTGTALLPELSPDQQNFGPLAFARSGLSEEDWNALSDEDRAALVKAEAELINDPAAE
jgi:hypothetical protein